MIPISVSQARQQFPSIIDRVFAGDSFVVTKQRLPVAEIRPIRREVRVGKKRIIPAATRILRDLQGSSLDVVSQWRDAAWKGTNGR